MQDFEFEVWLEDAWIYQSGNRFDSIETYLTDANFMDLSLGEDEAQNFSSGLLTEANRLIWPGGSSAILRPAVDFLSPELTDEFARRKRKPAPPPPPRPPGTPPPRQAIVVVVRASRPTVLGARIIKGGRVTGGSVFEFDDFGNKVLVRETVIVWGDRALTDAEARTAAIGVMVSTLLTIVGMIPDARASRYHDRLSAAWTMYELGAIAVGFLPGEGYPFEGTELESLLAETLLFALGAIGAWALQNALVQAFRRHPATAVALPDSMKTAISNLIADGIATIYASWANTSEAKQRARELVRWLIQNTQLLLKM
jgi:hypothetical protein